MKLNGCSNFSLHKTKYDKYKKSMHFALYLPKSIEERNPPPPELWASDCAHKINDASLPGFQVTLQTSPSGRSSKILVGISSIFACVYECKQLTMRLC